MEDKPIKFFTATILEWKSLLQSDKYKLIIVDSLKFLVEKKRIWLYGFVIMPNHLHLLWRMQEEFNESDVQRDFLKFTAQRMKLDLLTNDPIELEKYRVHAKDREFQFWERRPHSSRMYNRKVLEQKLDYIHNNPLSGKWSLTDFPENYQFSSAKYYLLNADDWGFITNYAEHL